MKTFEEWFECNYGDLYSDGEIGEFKGIAKEAWQAAKESQSESDSEVCDNFDNDGIP